MQRQAPKMKKILAIEYPIITSYTHHAHLLSILGTDKRTEEWIYSNYIQLYINKDLNKSNWADFYFPMPYEIKPVEICKWIQVQKNPEEFLDSKYKDIVEYILDAIDNDYYIHMMINYRYISSSRYSKENENKRHDVLIYGYDNELQVIKCADFTFKTSKYTFSECSYDEFRNAYYNDFLRNEPSYLNHMIYAYKLIDNCDYQFDIHNIIYALKQYISGNSPEYWNGYNYDNKKDIVWGIDYYQGLINNLENSNRDWIDSRFIYLLLDHNSIMQKRLEFMHSYLQNISSFINEYKEIHQDLTIVMNFAIKYNLHNKSQDKEKIIHKLKEIEIKERKLTNALIKVLEENSYEYAGM